MENFQRKRGDAEGARGWESKMVRWERVLLEQREGATCHKKGVAFPMRGDIKEKITLSQHANIFFKYSVLDDCGYGEFHTA